MNQVSKRILVVEDSRDNQILIDRFLRKQGYLLDFADDGAIGIQKGSVGAFDLILMDIQMPNVDGYTATRTLREMGVRTPIVALTAHAMTEDREKCMAAGCDDYLTKPINPALFREVVARHMSK